MTMVMATATQIQLGPMAPYGGFLMALTHLLATAPNGSIPMVTAMETIHLLQHHQTVARPWLAPPYMIALDATILMVTVIRTLTPHGPQHSTEQMPSQAM
jgi:L-alanine-DL-glutamate epimerase-like enolase superfamily enzyme